MPGSCVITTYSDRSHFTGKPVGPMLYSWLWMHAYQITDSICLCHGCTTSLRQRAENSRPALQERGQWTHSPPAARGAGECCKLPQWGRRKCILVYFELENRILVATFSIIYFSWNGTAWCILKYAYTFGVPNNWKPVNHQKYLTLEWIEIHCRTITGCHKFRKNNVRLKHQTDQFYF